MSMPTNTRQLYLCCITIKCGLLTFRGEPSLVNIISTTYFLPASPPKLPRNLNRYLFVYCAPPKPEVEPCETTRPLSQTFQSALISGSFLQSLKSNVPSFSPIMHRISPNGR